MRERCFRTALISPMLAPERSSARVTACLSASVNPRAGAIQFADAPPESSTSTRSSGPAPSASFSACSAAFKPRGVGIGWPGLDHRDDAWSAAHSPAAPRRCRSSRSRQIREIGRLRDLRHRARRLACRQHDQPARLRRRRQMRRQAGRRMRRRNRGAKQPVQECSRRHAETIAGNCAAGPILRIEMAGQPAASRMDG